MMYLQYVVRLQRGAHGERVAGERHAHARVRAARTVAARRAARPLLRRARQPLQTLQIKIMT